MDDLLMYTIVVVVVLVTAAGTVIWEKGWLGTATEARLKTMRAKIEAKAKAEIEAIEQKLAAKHEASSMSPIEVSLVKDKGTRIAENKALLDAKAITQEQYDAAVKQILAE